MSLFGWLFGRRLPRPETDFTKIDSAVRFIALDVETANDDRGSICQIGLWVVEDGDDGDGVVTLIDPRQPFRPDFTAIHGLSAASVRGSPRFADAFPKIAPLLERHPVIAHSDFDRQAILAACRQCQITAPAIRWFDSVAIARQAWPDLPNHKLNTLASHLGIALNHHDALSDARAAALITLQAEGVTGKPFTELATRPRQTKTFTKAVRKAGAADGPMTGEIAVFTGTLTISREDAAEAAALLGIAVKTSVSRKTTLLIVGDQDLASLAGHTKSTKHRTAEDLIAAGASIRILGESDFLALLKAR